MSAMLRVLEAPVPQKSRVRVAVVDDHAFMRDLIARTLSRIKKKYEVVAAVGTATEAVRAAREFQPDVLVLDINLPDRTGIAAVPDIRRVSPDTRILLCTAYPKEDWFTEASRCGAEGFVEKTNTWDDFLTAVEKVSHGERYFCSADLRGAAKGKTPVLHRSYRPLTAREREVLGLIADGLTTKEIAARLSVSVSTIESHRAKLMSKTGASNVAALVRFAVDARLH